MPRIPKKSQPPPDDDVTVLSSFQLTPPPLRKTNTAQKISSFVGSIQNVRQHEIRQVSYDSSLPSVGGRRGGGRGGGGGRGRKRQVVAMRTGGHKGQQKKRKEEKQDAKFDEFLSTLVENRDTYSIRRASDMVPSEEHIVVVDSPPSSTGIPASCPDAHTERSRTSSCSSDDLTPMERVGLMVEDKTPKGREKPCSPDRGARAAGQSDGDLSCKFKTADQNRDMVKGVWCRPEGGVVTECIDLDGEDECEITATTSRYFSAAAQQTEETGCVRMTRERRGGASQNKRAEEDVEASSTHPSPLHTPVKKGGHWKHQSSPTTAPPPPPLVPHQQIPELAQLKQTMVSFTSSVHTPPHLLNLKQQMTRSGDFIDAIGADDGSALPTTGSSLHTPSISCGHGTALLRAVHESNMAEGTPSSPHHHTVTTHQPPSPPHNHTITTHHSLSPPPPHTVTTHRPPSSPFHVVDFTFNTPLTSRSRHSPTEDQTSDDGEFKSSPRRFRVPCTDSGKRRGMGGREDSGACGKGGGGGGVGRGLRGRGRGGVRGRGDGEGGRSVFDLLEPESSNSASFYGGKRSTGGPPAVCHGTCTCTVHVHVHIFAYSTVHVHVNNVHFVQNECSTCMCMYVYMYMYMYMYL